MKKLLLVPILFIIALSSQAQERKHQRDATKHALEQLTPEERADRMTKRMTEQLSLTKEQQEKIHQLSLEQAKQHAEEAKQAKERAEARKAKSIKNREEIETVLTPEQRAKWDEAKSKHAHARRIKSNTDRKDFKRKPSMIKKADSIGSKKPMTKITPIVKETE